MNLPEEAPLSMVCDGPATAFFILGVRGQELHRNAMLAMSPITR